MSKIKVKFALVFVLCGLLSVAVFAEGDGSNSQGSGSSPAAQTEEQKAIEDTAKKSADEQKAKAPAEQKAQEGGKPNSGGGTGDSIKFRVTFNSDGGSSVEPIEVGANKPMGNNFPSQPAKEGYDFKEWRDISGAVFTKNTPIKNSTILTAQWEIKEFTVTFDLRGGTMSSKNTQKVTYNTPITKLTEPEKNDNKFDGWFLDSDFQNKFQEDKPIKEDIIIYAKWIPFSQILDNLESGNTWIKERIDNITNKTKNYGFFALTGIGIAALVLLALAALNFIATSKIRKKIPAVIQEKFDELAKKQDQAKGAILEKIGSRYTAQDTAQSAAEYLQNEVKRLETEKSEYQNRITGLEAENQSLKENKRIADGIKSGSLDPVSVFNNWAAYPSGSLPNGFMFLSGNIKMREAQNLSESGTETAWITNRDGAKRYLFPNPCLLSDRSNITAFYTHDGIFKPKGNKIRIKKPCEILDSGHISYSGELEIL